MNGTANGAGETTCASVKEDIEKTSARAEELKQQIIVLDERKERLMKQRPTVCCLTHVTPYEGYGHFRRGDSRAGYLLVFLSLPLFIPPSLPPSLPPTQNLEGTTPPNNRKRGRRNNTQWHGPSGVSPMNEQCQQLNTLKANKNPRMTQALPR